VSKLKPGQDVLIKVERRSGNDNERMLTTFLAGTVPANSAQ
jgi:hypothetical protein